METTQIKTFAELAQALGIQESLMRLYAKRGMPIRNLDGSYNHAGCENWLLANVRTKVGSSRDRMLERRRLAGAAAQPTGPNPGAAVATVGGPPDGPPAEKRTVGAPQQAPDGDDVADLPVPTTWHEKHIQVRVKKDSLEAELRSMKIAVQKGELVPLDQVKQFALNRGEVFRSTLLGDLPRRIAQATAGLPIKDAEQAIRTEFRRVLHALAGGEHADFTKKSRRGRPII